MCLSFKNLDALTHLGHLSPHCWIILKKMVYKNLCPWLAVLFLPSCAQKLKKKTECCHLYLEDFCGWQMIRQVTGPTAEQDHPMMRPQLPDGSSQSRKQGWKSLKQVWCCSGTPLAEGQGSGHLLSCSSDLQVTKSREAS